MAWARQFSSACSSGDSVKASVGVGFAFASLIGWLIGAFNHGAPLADYWPILPAFGLGAGLGLIAFQFPEWRLHLWQHRAEVEHLKTQAWNYQQERQVKPAKTAYLTPQVTVLSDHDRAWKHWLIRCAAESERVGGISWQKMRTFFGDDDKWRVYVDILERWGKSWPRQARQETFLKPGITPMLLYDLLIGGELPALPDGLPPVLEQRRQAESQTAENNDAIGADRANTAQTAYSAEH